MPRCRGLSRILSWRIQVHAPLNNQRSHCPEIHIGGAQILTFREEIGSTSSLLLLWKLTHSKTTLLKTTRLKTTQLKTMRVDYGVKIAQHATMALLGMSSPTENAPKPIFLSQKNLKNPKHITIIFQNPTKRILQNPTKRILQNAHSRSSKILRHND